MTFNPTMRYQTYLSLRPITIDGQLASETEGAAMVRACLNRKSARVSTYIESVSMSILVKERRPIADLTHL